MLEVWSNCTAIGDDQPLEMTDQQHTMSVDIISVKNKKNIQAICRTYRCTCAEVFLFLYGYGQHNSNPWCQYGPKPYQTWNFCTARFITSSSPACLEAEKAQTMRLPYRKRLPPPSSHPGDPKPHEEHRCFPIQLTGPPFPNGPGSPYPHRDVWRRPEFSRRERSHMSMPFIFPYPGEQHRVIPCLRRVTRVFFP